MLKCIRQKGQEQYDLSHVWDIKQKGTNKQKNSHRYRRQNGAYQSRGRVGGGYEDKLGQIYSEGRTRL